MSEGSVMGLRFRARVRFEGSGPEVRPKSILGLDSVGVVLGVRIRVRVETFPQKADTRRLETHFPNPSPPYPPVPPREAVAGGR